MACKIYLWTPLFGGACSIKISEIAQIAFHLMREAGMHKGETASTRGHKRMYQGKSCFSSCFVSFESLLMLYVFKYFKKILV